MHLFFRSLVFILPFIFSYQTHSAAAAAAALPLSGVKRSHPKVSTTPVDMSHADGVIAHKDKKASTASAIDVSLPHYDSPLKALVEPYIEQIVQIEFEGEDVDHIGTGFIFNAAEGVIVTNHHVITCCSGIFKVMLENGDEYDGDDVEILGMSPSQRCGDFGFLRIKKLAGCFPQIPVVKEHSIKKRDDILYIGHSEGSLTIEHGNVNSLYNFDMKKMSHSFQVQLYSLGGASGSPTFNARGEINGLLFGGTDSQTTVLPICCVIDGYNMMMGADGIYPISFKSLGGYYSDVSIYDIAKYHKVTPLFLKDFIPEKDKTVQRLLKFECLYEGADSGVIESGDILLSINDTVIGCDTHVITKLINESDSVSLNVLRRGKVISQIITPKVYTQEFARTIDMCGYKICSSNTGMDDCGFKPGLPILMNSADSIDDIDGENDTVGIITHIDDLSVVTFEDAVRAVYKAYAVDHYKHILARVVGTDGKARDTVEVSLNALFRKDLYMNHFDRERRQWTNSLLKDAIPHFPRKIKLKVKDDKPS